MMDTYTAFPKDKTIVDLFLEQVAKTPNNVAVEFEGDTLSYQELNERSNQLAYYLKSFGVKEDSLVPICLHRSLDMVIGALGILKAGAAYVPIDPDYPIDRIDYIIKDTGGEVIITESGSPLSCQSGKDSVIYLDQDRETIQKESIELPQNNLKPHHLAYVIYTSGSTGRPKGVMIEHHNLVQLFMSNAFPFDFKETDVWTMFHSFCFDFSVWEMYGALLYGGKIIVIPQYLIKDSAAFSELVITKGVTILNQTPSAFYVLQENLLNKIKQNTIRYVILGGESLNPTKLKKWKLTFPACKIVNMYGITETAIVVTYQPIDLEYCNNSTSLIGKPFPNYYTYLLNENQKPTKIGEEGELYVGGPGLARGYLNMPQLTKERFIKDPFSNDPHAKLYRTGDLVIMDVEQKLEYVSRIDDQVKIRGYRIELREIENMLLANSAVNQAVVLAQDDRFGNKRLIAYIVTNTQFDKKSITSYLESRLPHYMVPQLIMELNEIPLTSNGKTDKKNLPNPDASELINTLYVAPKNKTEKIIIDIWKNLLQLDKIGINDSFFELGGNSLLAQSTVSTLLTKEIILPITKLYQYPTAAGITTYLNDGIKTKTNKKPKRKQNRDDIAVIAMAGRFPGANSIEELWNNLKEGKESIQFFSEEELDTSIPDSLKKDTSYVKARGIIDGANEFDPNFFAINPKLAEVMDPQQRKFLEIAWEALESAGHLSENEREEIGIYAGSGRNTYFNNNINPNKELIDLVGDFNVQTLSDKDFLATRVAYALDLKGPAITVQSACSTSLLAIAEAVESIRSGQCKMALAGGITIHTPIKSGHIFEEGAILSKDGHCRTFDADAQGTLFSDGAAVVLLKDRKQAELDGDTIYAVIKGIGISNDGGVKGSFTAPSADGQSVSIIRAFEDAEIDPSTISYVEAHGTATPIGDPIEIEGLNIAFGKQEKNQYCAIGSIKSNMGHLIHAAGAAGFIKTCLSIYNKQIPPSINFDKPNPHLQLENSPFYVNDKLSDWNSTEKRRAGVSSFGVGGTNVHIVLEEHQQSQKESLGGRPFELITWSAKSDESRDNYGIKLKDYLTNHTEIKIADLAYTLQTNKAEFNHRRFTIGANREDLISKLNPLFVPAEVKTLKEKHDQLIFIFPGQGSQYLNMGRELYRNEPVFKEAIDECADLLKEEIGEDIREIIYSESTDLEAEEKLNNTFYTQPSLFITEYALAKLWMSWGIQPDIFIGHSIGEFVAAHLAGIFSLKDGLHLITSRAKLMADLPEGSMLAVRANHENILPLLNEDLSIAAVNSPNLCVVAGPIKQINSFFELLETKDIPSKLLRTSHAFHSSMMDSIISPFEQIVKSIKLNIPKTPIVSTLTGQWMKDIEATDSAYWAKHLRSTVRFADAIKTLIEEDQHLITLECGPRSGSTILIRQQINNKPVLAIPSLDYSPNQNEYYSFLKAVGQLWLNGVSVQWDSFYSNQKRIKLHDIPTYAFEKKVCWINPPTVEQLQPVANSIQSNHGLALQQNQQQNRQPVNTIMRKPVLIQKLKQILENASGIETEGVNPDSSFLEIGLDSLLLTQLALTLKKEFKLPVTFRKLTEEYGSLTLLAEYLDANLPKETNSESASKPNGTQIPVNGNSNSLQIVSPEAANNNNSAMGLISQQIQLLAQQIALLQNGDNAQSISSVVTNGDHISSQKEPDITAEEAIELKKPFGATAKIEKYSKELNPKQKEYLDNLIIRYNKKTKRSKEYTQEHRAYMADPRVVSGFRPPTKEMVYQLVVEKSKGSYLWDIDGNKYIDMLNGFGSTMLGYQPDFIKKALIEQIEKGYEIGPQHALAGEVSKLICEFTKHERAALCNTGSEAILGAMRIARTVTGKSLIVAFTGSYHGIMDEVLVRGTKKLKTFPAASGIMPEAVQNMLILDYGTEESLEIINERADEIAAVLVEPVQSRRPEFQPIEFLKGLRALTSKADIALIFDEIITGFRMHPGGTQALFGIKADIATYGKVVGGGVSIGVIAGKKQYMDALDGGYWEYGDDSYPEVGVTYFAGTFVRHPLALAAAKAILLYMKEKGPKLQEDLNQKTHEFADKLQNICNKFNLPFFVVRFGSLWKIKYKEEYPYSELLFTLMREKGVHIWDGFPCFLVESHTKDELEFVVQKFEESIIELLYHDFIPNKTPEIQPLSEVTETSLETPPVSGALLGKDADGNPAWFLPDDNIPGKFLQLNS